MELKIVHCNAFSEILHHEVVWSSGTGIIVL